MVLKPFDIEAPWFTELLEAIGQPNGLNCEHHNYLRMQEFEIAPVDRWTANDVAELMAFFTTWSWPNLCFERVRFQGTPCFQILRISGRTQVKW